MIFTKKIIIALSIILCLAFISVAGLKSYNYISTAGSVSVRPTIILDAGHGELSNTIE